MNSSQCSNASSAPGGNRNAAGAGRRAEAMKKVPKTNLKYEREGGKVYCMCANPDCELVGQGLSM